MCRGAEIVVRVELRGAGSAGYGHIYTGPPSVTVPECNSAGQALVNAGRFDFYRCVAIDRQTEELEGFLITG
jgi:hypothetical protein